MKTIKAALVDQTPVRIRRCASLLPRTGSILLDTMNLGMQEDFVIVTQGPGNKGQFASLNCNNVVEGEHQTAFYESITHNLEIRAVKGS